MKNMQIVQKISSWVVEAKESVVAEYISTIKKNPSTWYQDNKEDALKAS